MKNTYTKYKTELEKHLFSEGLKKFIRTQTYSQMHGGYYGNNPQEITQRYRHQINYPPFKLHPQICKAHADFWRKRTTKRINGKLWNRVDGFIDELKSGENNAKN